MKNLLYICVAICCFVTSLVAQMGGVSYVPSPSGACNSTAVVIDADGITHTCKSGTWASSLSGIVFLVTSGVCPSYSTEIAALSGVTLVGTTHANGDVGSTGGSNSITPAGTVSQPSLSMNAYTPTGTVAAPTFSGTPGTVPAETFSGTSNQTTSATSAGTPAGTNGTAAVTTVGTKFTTSSSGTYAFTTLAGTASAASPTVTVPAETFSGSALATHTHTLTPAGTNSTASFTPAGTNSAPAFSGTPATLTGTVSQPSFTGNAFDPHPAFVKVIFCSFN